MCTRANHRSVPDSLHALIGSVAAFASAFVMLVMAVITIPFRLVRPRPTKHGNPASIDHVEVQVHLGNRERVSAIEHNCRAALERAARTWAPFPLPLDRVEVLSSAPPLGKVDIYEQWVHAASGAIPMAGSLVVVSIGTALEARDLTPDEIAGALAGQIERLVIDRYKREQTGCRPGIGDGIRRRTRIQSASRQRHRIQFRPCAPRGHKEEPAASPGWPFTERGSSRA